MSGTESGQTANSDPSHPSISDAPSTEKAPANLPSQAAVDETDSDAAQRRRILIGSQRDPAAYRARRQRDWIPIADEAEDVQGDSAAAPSDREPAAPVAQSPAPIPAVPTVQEQHQAQDDALLAAANSESLLHVMSGRDVSIVPESSAPAAPVPTASAPPSHTGHEQSMVESAVRVPKQRAVPSVASLAAVPASPASAPAPVKASSEAPSAAAQDSQAPLAVPSRRERLSPELEDELAMALGGASIEDLMVGGTETVGGETGLEPESRHRARVVAVRRDDVFVELGGREQGCLPLIQFTTPPAVGDMIEVVVQRFNAEDGLYDLGLPGTSIDIANWDDVQEGMLVEAQVTGHNTGGLECEVNHIRAFIPMSQVALYRVEDVSEFVGQKLACLITEANPMRRNLVLSRRAVLEREKEENRQKFFESLQPGQVHEGVVRKLMDFGAFVDLGGGVDGLLHVSQLSWGRVNHPSEVLTQGQAIRVKVEKVDCATGRISLAYRDMLDNPWDTAASKYPTNTITRGKVTKLMEFGAFVELEPGVEGLIHISELSHKRIWRASDVVHEGDEIEVLVLNVNVEAQRMSLSIKALSKPEPSKKEKEAAAADAEPVVEPKKRGRPTHTGPLRGGLGKSAGGESLGLNW